MKPKTPKHVHLLHTIEPPLPTGVRYYCLLCRELVLLLSDDAYPFTPAQIADMMLINRLPRGGSDALLTFVHTALTDAERLRLAALTCTRAPAVVDRQDRAVTAALLAAHALITAWDADGRLEAYSCLCGDWSAQVGEQLQPHTCWAAHVAAVLHGEEGV